MGHIKRQDYGDDDCRNNEDGSPSGKDFQKSKFSEPTVFGVVLVQLTGFLAAGTEVSLQFQLVSNCPFGQVLRDG